MKTPISRTGDESTSARLKTLCLLGIFVISVATVRAADPRTLSLDGSVSIAQVVPYPVAPTVTGCPITILPTDGTAATGERAPNANFRFGRAVYLITATETAANGLVAGMNPGAIGWRYVTAPGVTATGTLIVYLQNTTDTTNTKSTTWSTAISGMTVVHNAATLLPDSRAPFDISFAGGAAFTYTGGGLYVAFDWQWAGPVGSGAVVATNINGIGLLKGAQSNVSAPNTIASISGRPETRLRPAGATQFDASVDLVYSLGSLAQSLVGPQVVQAVVTNRGINVLSNLPVTFNLTGAEAFTNTQTVASLRACGGQATVTFAPFTPSAIGSDTVTVSVPTDEVAGNNSKSNPLDESFNLYSYKYPGTTSLGLGFTGDTGTVVNKFTIAAAAKISAVNLDFIATTATTYRVAIYPDFAGGPGLTPLYLDSVDRTVTVAGPVTIMLPFPLAVGPGSFYAGIQQTNTINASVGGNIESPVRVGSFFVARPNPPTEWFEYSQVGGIFKLNVGVTLVQCSTAAECNDNDTCTDDACTNQLCAHTNNTSSCSDGNPCSGPDACSAGICSPGPNPCNDNNACTVDLCDGQGGGCTYGPTNCNDNNPCTDDSCVPATGCIHTDNAAPCSDNNLCTIGDVCSGGVCRSGAPPSPVQFCSNEGITINELGEATPYPSAIVVAGQPSYLCSTTVDLNGFGHSYPSDVDVLLARLTGSNALIMSDEGGSTGVTDVNLTLSDAATTSLSNVQPLVSGTFRPSNSGLADDFPAPAPTPTGGSVLSVFTGVNPNGAWNLWVVDAFQGDGGSMSGWCVNLASVCVSDADCSDGNPCTLDVCGGGICSSGPPITVPPETSAMTVAADKSTYSWSAASFATQYDVVRGSTSAFPVGPGGGDETCFDNLPGTSVVDATVPAPNSGFWYLSRGENACGIGTYGTQSNGSPRITTTCP